MENRTPAFVDKVRQLLPPPPRVSFEFPDGAPRVVIRDADEEDDALGWALRGRFGDHGDDSIYRGMFLFKRPESDAVDAAWKAAPLVFHDKRLVDTAHIRLPRHLISTPLDFTKTIDAILHRQPGPVKFFGADRSACPGPELLADWIDVLSEKNVEWHKSWSSRSTVCEAMAP
ncbi:hypothetical protein PR202_ga22401 [Eleusine coracana subsp. coracana]|uniref:Uncharacterized protein n=1 Tax=Eleusine coracana subsp. coracana TaxID=191504 RepID=A0AAV5D317_ELECO|nr:hypothetical protein PR202_ga22401 [Eleusine coracana subsp. coracana]